MSCQCGAGCTFEAQLRQSQAQLRSMSILHYPPTLALSWAKTRVMVARRAYEAHTENPASASNG